MPAPRRSPPAISLDARVRIPEGILFKDLSGDTVLLNLNTGVYFGLDHVGARIWQLLEERLPIRDIVERLREEFEVPPATLERDVLALLVDLKDEGLISHA